MKKSFKLNVDCADCAAKMEESISKIDGVNKARVNFMMQKLTLDADDERFEEILDEAQKRVCKIDDDVVIAR